jgi:anti-sigma-K factor RskA
VNDAHERYEQDLGAYMLEALEEDESRALEQHLEDCAHCRAEQQRLRLAADALPRSVLQVAPPASLKASLMTEVYGEAPAAPRRRLRDLLPDLGGMRPQLAWVSASFLLAVGIACGWGISQLAGSDDTRVITAQVDEKRVPFASASLVVPEDSDSGAILRVNGMPTLPTHRVYQVWIQRGRELTPGTLFNVGEDGTGTPAVRSLADAEAVLVTREAAGGARAPSEEPILQVRL